MSKIEKELVEATELKAKKGEDRQKFLRRLVTAVQALPEAGWEALTTPAQNWANKGQVVVNDGEPDDEIKDFKDAKPALVEDDEDEAEAKPSKKKAAAADEDEEPAEEEAEEEEPAPKKKGKVAKAEPEEEVEEEAAEEEPVPKKKAARKAEPDDDEEEETEVKKPAKKTGAKPPVKKAAAVAKEAPAKKKVVVKEKKEKELSGPKFDATKMVIKNPGLTTAELVEKLGGKKAGVSEITVAAVRANVRHTLMTLKALDLLDAKIKI